MSIRAEIEIFINKKFEVEVAPLEEKITELATQNDELKTAAEKVGRQARALNQKLTASDESWTAKFEAKESELRNAMEEAAKEARASAIKTAFILTLAVVIPLTAIGYLAATRSAPAVEVSR